MVGMLHGVVAAWQTAMMKGLVVVLHLVRATYADVSWQCITGIALLGRVSDVKWHLGVAAIRLCLKWVCIQQFRAQHTSFSLKHKTNCLMHLMNPS